MRCTMHIRFKMYNKLSPVIKLMVKTGAALVHKTYTRETPWHKATVPWLLLKFAIDEKSNTNKPTGITNKLEV